MANRVIGRRRPKIAIANTNIIINDCQVLLGHPNPAQATSSARLFGKQLTDVVARAKCVNMSDVYTAMVDIQKKLEAGIPLCN